MKALRFLQVAAVATAALTAVAHAQTQDFYRAKTLTILVGYSPGGGYDAYARLLSRHIGQHISGTSNVIVQYMPGAATLTSVLYLDSTAPKDGTVIDIFDFGEIGESRMGVTPVKIDFRKFNWIGSITQDVTACYTWHTLGIKTIADVKTHGTLHFGVTALGASNDVNQKILKNIFGLDIQQVAGYPGSAEERLAIEHGELDGDCGTWSSAPADWIANKEIVPFYRSASIVPPDMSPDVPYAVDIAPTPRDAQIIRLLVGSSVVGRPFIAPLSVPADHMKILRDAFDATMKDPAFLADAAKQGLPISPKNAAEALSAVEAIYATPDDIVDAARKIVGQ
jgi:tripartite-type tricarboxylate transporter receptor subunit TctC